ncbi:MAG: tetratricopeptide repeat protein, partial [Spirochaetia bacterium]|nr:tetratricopeptide repeat protein [Spirochaetia bacterium]
MNQRRNTLIGGGILLVLVLSFFGYRKWASSPGLPDDALLRDIDHLVTEIASNTSDVARYIELARLYQKHHMIKDAIRTLEQALEIKTITDKERYQVHLFLSELYLENGDTDKASRSASEARRLDPRKAAPYNRTGKIEEKKGNEKQAIKEYEKAQKLEPTDPESYLNRALLHEKQSEFDKAQKLLQEGIRHNPKSAAAERYMGDYLTRRTRYKEALSHLNKAVALGPTDARNHYSKGRTHNAAGEKDPALVSAEKAADLDPKMSQANELAGDIYGEKTAWTDAAERYKRALEYDHDNKPLQEKYRHAKKLADEKAKNTDGTGDKDNGPGKDAQTKNDATDDLGPADKDAKHQNKDGGKDVGKDTAKDGAKTGKDKTNGKTGKDHPGDKIDGKTDQGVDVGALKAKGRKLYGEQRYTEALELFDSAAKAAPKDADAQYLRGRTLDKLSRDSEAVTALKRSIELDPKNAKPPFHLGQVYARLGDHKSAADSYKRALSVDPSLGDARFNLAVSLEKAGDTTGAKAAYKEAVTKDPADWRSANNLAVLLKKRGENAEAVPVLDAAIQASPSQPSLYQQRGEVLSRLGRNGEAVA